MENIKSYNNNWNTEEQLSLARVLNIANDKDNESAGYFLRGLKTLQKAIKEELEPEIKTAYEAHKALTAGQKKLMQPLEQAEIIVKTKISEYATQQELVRKAEQRRLEEAARKAEETRRLEEAAILESRGEMEAATEVLAEAVAAPAPFVFVPKAAPTAGISMRTTWDWEIVDEDKIPRVFMTVDTKKISKVVDAMKSAANIAGIRVYETQQVAARGW
jgi:hypothetical protein